MAVLKAPAVGQEEVRIAIRVVTATIVGGEKFLKMKEALDHDMLVVPSWQPLDSTVRGA